MASKARREIALKALSALGLILIWAFVGWVLIRTSSANTSAAAPLPHDRGIPIVLRGQLRSAAGTVPSSARVTLALHAATGEVVIRVTAPVDTNGGFFFAQDQLPTLAGQYPTTVVAEARNHLATKADVVISIPQSSRDPTTVTPSFVELWLSPYNPWLTFLVVVPGLFGLIFTIIHLTQVSNGIWVTYAYACGATFLWCVVIAALVFRYASADEELIPLFWPDFFISSSVVVFSFLGTLIYAAYSIHDRPVRFFWEATTGERRKLMLTVGGRILVAPYIAMTAYGIFASTFPSLKTGPFASFFGFFTGLYIKPVIKALNAIGLRMLGPENSRRVMERFEKASVATEMEVPPSTSGAALRPEPGLVGAVRQLRAELAPEPEVLGVDIRHTDATGLRLCVYAADPTATAVQVPSSYMGIPVEVLPLRPIRPSADGSGCRSDVFAFSWEKVRALGGGAALGPPVVGRVGEVTSVATPSAFVKTVGGAQVLDAQSAWLAVKEHIGDEWDFVFFILPERQDRYVCSYYVPIYNDVAGINHFQGSSYSARPTWKTEQLRGVQVVSDHPLTLRTLLHEFGHAWCAYATFCPSGQAQPSYELLIGQGAQNAYHWGSSFDDGKSCMDYDYREWQPLSGGYFERRVVADEEFDYCLLDLYLMGLATPAEVGEVRVLRNIQPALSRKVTRYRAEEVRIPIDAVIRAIGTRAPPPKWPRTYRVSFVAIADTPTEAETLARAVEALRPRFEAAFKRATRERAEVSTSLSLS